MGLSQDSVSGATEYTLHTGAHGKYCYKCTLNTHPVVRAALAAAPAKQPARGGFAVGSEAATVESLPSLSVPSGSATKNAHVYSVRKLWSVGPQRFKVVKNKTLWARSKMRRPN